MEVLVARPKRTKAFLLMLTPLEHAMVIEAAGRADMSASAFIRAAIVQHIARMSAADAATAVAA